MKMTSLKTLAVSQILLASPHPVIAESELSLTADTPTAVVLPRDPERAPLILPDLEFIFRIQADCHNDLEPASISLAVADTRRTFNSAQIASGELNAVKLRIPASQIAPVIIANFCVAATGNELAKIAAGPVPPLTIRSALSAHASLLCVSENRQSMKYISAALDVLLQCDVVGAPPGRAPPL